jgi:hypothetical protein
MRLPSLTFVLAAALTLAGIVPAQAKDSPPQGPPRLVLAISVDQFSADLFAQYREHFTGGLARLMQGAVFPSAFQAHAATETCPGHSTLLTGGRPSRTGIVANSWYDPAIARADKRIYCVEDERDPASTSRNPVVSAVHLKVPTLGERLKAANPASLNVAVSAKDRAAIMMGGHVIDAVYWWKDGRVATLPGRANSPATSRIDAATAHTIAAGAPAMAVPAWCRPRDEALALDGVTIGTGRFAAERGKEVDFRVSPRMDAATADLALALVDEFALGKDDAPDVLSVSFSATDYIGHAYGTEGVEMCIQMAELDRTIGRLLAQLDRRGIDYLVMLSADHGGIDAPERLARQALPGATRGSTSLLPGNLSTEITKRTGIALPSGSLLLGDGIGGDYYFSEALPTEAKARALAALVAILKENAQVAAVFTAQELAEAPLPAGGPREWSLKDRARASFDARRSGDVVVLLQPAVVAVPRPAPGIVTTHGSPWDYDRRVPLLFWRRGMTGFEQPAPVETVDIAPTLAPILHLAVPDGAFDGRCLDLDAGEGNSCAQ